MTMGPGHGGPMQMMRSFARDPAVVDKKLAPGTARRIARFASPYKNQLIAFLVVIVIDAVVAIAPPLVLAKIIDDGIGTNPPSTGRPGLVMGLALFVVGLAVFDGVLGLINRWYSARIGEGLIYDLRSQVYAHVQRMPIAFFTRTHRLHAVQGSVPPSAAGLRSHSRTSNQSWRLTTSSCHCAV